MYIINNNHLIVLSNIHVLATVGCCSKSSYFPVVTSSGWSMLILFVLKFWIRLLWVTFVLENNWQFACFIQDSYRILCSIFWYLSGLFLYRRLFYQSLVQFYIRLRRFGLYSYYLTLNCYESTTSTLLFLCYSPSCDIIFFQLYCQTTLSHGWLNLFL